METIKKSDIMLALGSFVSVKNMPSRNGYGTAPNQFLLTFENGTVFQSYDSVIGVKIRGDRTLYLTGYHDYSNTTSGYCGRWCGHNCAERRKMLEDGRAVKIVEG